VAIFLAIPTIAVLLRRCVDKILWKSDDAFKWDRWLFFEWLLQVAVHIVIVFWVAPWLGWSGLGTALVVALISIFIPSFTIKKVINKAVDTGRRVVGTVCNVATRVLSWIGSWF
jgi:hypothetical protein